MKTAPISYTEMAIGAGVLVLGFVVFRLYSAAPKTLAEAVEKSANAVDVRQTAPDSLLGQSQSWVDSVVQKGQDAGASTFASSFFTGLFK